MLRRSPLQSPSRRAVLIAPVAALAGIPPAPAADATSLALLEEVRRVGPLLLAAINAEGDLEDTPNYEPACARSDALQAELDALSDTIWSRPVTCWEDVAARAIISDAWEEHHPRTHRLAALTAEYRGDRAAAEVIEAVLTLAGHRNV
jgi:hypothetical protein